MSADNMIYIQKRGKKWWVWMGFASDEKEPKPRKNDANFKYQDQAWKHAEALLYNEVVEYGIFPLPPK